MVETTNLETTEKDSASNSLLPIENSLDVNPSYSYQQAPYSVKAPFMADTPRLLRYTPKDTDMLTQENTNNDRKEVGDEDYSAEKARDEGVEDDNEEAPVQGQEFEEVTNTRPDGGWGWCVLLGAFMIMVLVSAAGPCFSLVFSPLLTRLGSSSAEAGMVFAAFSLVWNLTGPLVGPLVQEVGLRRVAATGVLLFSVALMLSAPATTAWMLVLSFSLLGGAGAGLSVTCSMLVLPQYFSSRLGRANGILAAGTSVGMFLAPHLITFLNEQYTFRGAAMLLGAITLHGCVFAALFQPVTRHPRGGKGPVMTTLKHVHSQEARVEWLVCRVLKSTWRHLGILSQRRAAIISATSTLVLISYLNFLLLVPFAMAAAGHSQKEIDICVSVGGVCNLLARVLVGLAADVKGFPMRGFYMTTIALAALSTIAFTLSPKVIIKMIAMGVWGWGIGGFTVMYNLVMIRYMGAKNHPAMIGASSLLNAFGFVTLVPLLGYLRDVSESFHAAMWVTATMQAACVILWCFMPCAQRSDNKRRVTLSLA